MFTWHNTTARSAGMKAALLGCTALCATSAQPGAAHAAGTSAAADAADGGLADIVVTAQRRDQRLQDVPISVSSVSAEALRTGVVLSTADLFRMVPSLTVNSTNGRFFPRIRGVGNEITNPAYENGVATYIDGIYVASTAGGIMSLASVERVEVLKGPQGTLFGRNSTGGLINVITRTPSQEFGARVTVGYGNYQTFTADGYVTGGLSDSIAVDLAGHISQQGEGFGTNLATGQDVYRLDDDYAVRASLLGDFGGVQLRVSGDYSLREGSTNPTTTAPGSYPVGGQVRVFDNPWDVAIDTVPKNRLESYGGSAKLDFDLSVGTFTSITAYREADSFISIDGDTTALRTSEIYLQQYDHQFSQELQLASGDDSTLTWIVGLHYFDAESGYDPSRVRFNPPFNRPLPGGGRVAEVRNRPVLTTEAIAGFAQVTVPLGADTNLTGGFRHTWEERTIESTGELDVLNGPSGLPATPVPQRTTRIDRPTWRIALDHRISPELLAYVSYNRGFKSGGFNANAPTDPPYSPETLDAYEVGLKSDLLDRRLRLNVAGYYYDYTDIQIARFVGGATIIYNGGDARTYGLDVDFEYQPIPALTLSGGIALLDAEFTDAPGLFFYVPNPNPPFGNTVTVGNGDGNGLPYSPDFVVTIRARYEIPTSFGTVALDGGYYRSTAYYTNADNVLEQPTFDLVNLGVALQLDNGLEFRLFAQNVSDEAVSSSRNCSPSSCAITYRPTRTYGATLSARF
jgi:iron complex outermembrane recepter protein